jgi:hypothetical protein
MCVLASWRNINHRAERTNSKVIYFQMLLEIYTQERCWGLCAFCIEATRCECVCVCVCVGGREICVIELLSREPTAKGILLCFFNIIIIMIKSSH